MEHQSCKTSLIDVFWTNLKNSPIAEEIIVLKIITILSVTFDILEQNIYSRSAILQVIIHSYSAKKIGLFKQTQIHRHRSGA